jgi:hypothetical protein
VIDIRIGGLCPPYAYAANNSSKASICPPRVEDGTSIGVLTPAVPYTSDARWDTWKRTGLDPANMAAFLEIVSAAEARGEAP